MKQKNDKVANTYQKTSIKMSSKTYEYMNEKKNVGDKKTPKDFDSNINQCDTVCMQHHLLTFSPVCGKTAAWYSNYVTIFWK